MKTAVAILAIGGALVLQAMLSGLLIGGTIAVNLVLVAVVYFALAYGAATGLLAGAIAGLAQDALAGGIVGVGGMANTVIGFVVGVLSAQFNLSSTVPRLVIFMAATFVHELAVAGLQGVVGGRHFALRFSAMFIQALVNGLIGVVAFGVVEHGPETVQRCRVRRATMLSKRRL